jgi:hypothetical protein
MMETTVAVCSAGSSSCRTRLRLKKRMFQRQIGFVRDVTAVAVESSRVLIIVSIRDFMVARVVS